MQRKRPEFKARVFINDNTAQELACHPLIDEDVASAIVSERESGGPLVDFKDVLARVDGVDEALAEKLYNDEFAVLNSGRPPLLVISDRCYGFFIFHKIL